MNFRDKDEKGVAIGRQATKTDLVDIGVALGLPVTDSWTVPTLREVIRNRLRALQAAGRFRSTEPVRT